MARSVRPLVTRNSRVISNVYYSCFDHSGSSAAGLPDIPPERVGLHGEYDYYGLAKRVQASLNQHFGHEVTARLVIQQRGSALLLSGKVLNWQTAERLAQLILNVEGATQVELHHLQVIEPRQSNALSGQLASAQA
jgi:hypothetical protein